MLTTLAAVVRRRAEGQSGAGGGDVEQPTPACAGRAYKFPRPRLTGRAGTGYP